MHMVTELLLLAPGSLLLAAGRPPPEWLGVEHSSLLGEGQQQITEAVMSARLATWLSLFVLCAARMS